MDYNLRVLPHEYPNATIHLWLGPLSRVTRSKINVNMKLFIIIVSFNNSEDLERLLKSLGKEKVTGWELEIVVVENGEVAKNKEQRTNNKVRIIYNNKNLGFAKGANISIKFALDKGADSIVLLNPDTEVKSGFIQPLVNNSADIVSPVIKFKRDEKWVYDLGGRINWWIGRTGHLESTNYPIIQLSNYPIDYVSGCCMYIKRQVFEKIGLVDERFFMYFEDADFCTRAGKAGFKIGIEPKAVITHKLIEGEERNGYKKYNLLRSNFIFINKYLGRRKFIGYLYLFMLAVKIGINAIMRGRTSLRGATS